VLEFPAIPPPLMLPLPQEDIARLLAF